MLDAARAVVLRSGVRAATISAISAASGASSGSIYHAFDSQQAVLAQLWVRATKRAQQLWLEAEASRPDDPVEAGAAMAVSLLGLAGSEPDEVRILTVLRPTDFPDVEVDFSAHNDPIRQAVGRVAARLKGPDAVTRVHLATVEIPYGALQVRLGHGLPIPDGLASYLGTAARAVLAQGETNRNGACR